jgi:hypothetical protein
LEKNEIRRRTLLKQDVELKRFITFIDNLIVAAGVKSRFADVFRRIYCDKLLGWNDAAQFARAYAAN